MADSKSDCSVCMVDIKSKHQVVRSCGHMMCVACDAEWRSRGKIVRKTGEKTTETGKVSVSVFVLESSCPCCRGLEQADAYLGRSRESLIHEIQMLSATLYENNQYVPIPYTFIPKKVFECAKDTPIIERQLPVRSVSDEVYIPFDLTGFIQRAVGPFIPQAPPQAPQAPPQASLGVCIRRRRNLGCTTRQTRILCPHCAAKLCRSCRGRCPCTNVI
jgi:hypothetical protein